jgi:choline transport protein
MQSKTSKDVGADTTGGSLSAVVSHEIGAVESLGQTYSKTNANSADDAILRAQGHTAAMPRLFSIVSTMGLMFWYPFLGSMWSITVS